MTPGQSADVWATYYACRTYAEVLGRPVPDVAGLERWLRAAQHEAGGLSWAPGGAEPDVRACYYGAVAWRAAAGDRRPPWRTGALVAWLRGQQAADGGFGFAAGSASCSWAAFRAVRALDALGAQPRDAAALRAWLARRRLDGGRLRALGRLRPGRRVGVLHGRRRARDARRRRACACAARGGRGLRAGLPADRLGLHLPRPRRGRRQPRDRRRPAARARAAPRPPAARGLAARGTAAVRGRRHVHARPRRRGALHAVGGRRAERGRRRASTTPASRRGSASCRTPTAASATGWDADRTSSRPSRRSRPPTSRAWRCTRRWTPPPRARSSTPARATTATDRRPAPRRR